MLPLFFTSYSQNAVLADDDFDFERAFQVLPETEIVMDNFMNLQNGSFQFFLV